LNLKQSLKEKWNAIEKVVAGREGGLDEILEENIIYQYIILFVF